MMIDFHCHILPKMDDGSDSINTSLAMLREEHTQGVNRVVLTPHFYCEEESIEAFLQRRKKAFSALQTAISDQPHTDDIPELCLGAEVAMSSALAQMDLQPLCISGTNVLLLELPYYRRFRLKPSSTETIFKLYLPILSGFPVYGIKRPLQQSWNCPSTNKLTVALFIMLAGDSGGSCSAGFQMEKCTCWVQTHTTSPLAL